MRERNATLTQGVHGAEFTLGRRATQGLWKITYELHVSTDMFSCFLSSLKSGGI